MNNIAEAVGTKWLFRSLMVFIALIVIIVTGGIILSNRQVNFYKQDCAAAFGHVKDLGQVSICVDADGRVIDSVERRFF